VHTKFLSENLKGRDNSEDLGVDGRISEWILGKREGVVRINLDQDRNEWRALVKTVMNLRVPFNAGTFLTSCVTASQ